MDRNGRDDGGDREQRGSGFYVQCLSGHVHEVLQGSPLEKKCRQRRDGGRLDALCISADECPSCLQERIQQEGLGNDELAHRWRGEPVEVA